MAPPDFLAFLARGPSGMNPGVVPFAARGK
jgi:hypothetical protein